MISRPCLCGFHGSKWAMQKHRPSCPVWQSRDKRTIYRQRVAESNQRRGFITHPICPDCHFSIRSDKHRMLCQTGSDRLRKIGIHPADFAKILKVLAKRLMLDPVTGRPVPRPREAL